MDPLTLGDMPEEFTELPDGSVEFMEELEEVTFDSDFKANLVDEIDSDKLNDTASELVELVEKDKESRKKRDEQYEEGLRRTGLGNDAPGGAEFDGASRVVHPVLVEACVDFSSRAIKELFPAAGPVKSHVVGEHSPEKTERSARKVRHMNWQLTTQIQEYRSMLEQLLTQLPLGGSQYQKFWYNTDLGRTSTEFVSVDEMILPYAATNFYSAQRATHRQLLTKFEFNRRIKSGLYKDIFENTEFLPGGFPEQTQSGEANDKIEGREEDGYNEDGLRAVLEIYTWADFEDDDEVSPYIITIDEDTEKVLAVYRNWKETDLLRRKLDWFVEWKFIPWRGAYAIGLPHIIGGISGALTGALRALLDSAHINNAASMLKLKGGRVVGQSKEVNITEITEIEAPAGVDDIRKIAMPMPFNPPSPVLLQLMDSLYGLSKGVVSTTNEQLAQVGDRTPVGTTMALIEQGSSVYSAIHARLHESQKKSLEILHRLNEEFLDEESLTEELGEQLVTKEDYTGTMDVIPVSDPTIFSESQRFAQTQALIQMSADQSVPWNKLNVYRRALKQMRIENIDDLLPGEKEPVTADFLTENGALTEAMPIKAVKEQDHWAHIQGHLGWLSNPVTMNNPLLPPQMLMEMLSHIGIHINFFISTVIEQAAMQIPGVPPEQAALQAQQAMAPVLGQTLGPVLQQVQQLQQALQQRMPPPPMPPEVQASIQIAQMEIQRKTAADQANMQTKQQLEGAQLQAKQAELQFDQQLEQARFSMEQQKQQVEQQLDHMRFQQDQQVEQLRQQVELMKNQRDNEQKQETEIRKNDDDNQTSIIVNQMREQSHKERALMVEMLKQMSQSETQFPDISPQLQDLIKLFEELGSAEVTIIGESHGN